MVPPSEAPAAAGVGREQLARLLERALADADFLAALAADPLGTALAAGVRVTAADVKALLGMPEATDQEMVEVVRARLCGPTGASCGCGS